MEDFLAMQEQDRISGDEAIEAIVKLMGEVNLVELLDDSSETGSEPDDDWRVTLADLANTKLKGKEKGTVYEKLKLLGNLYKYWSLYAYAGEEVGCFLYDENEYYEENEYDEDDYYEDEDDPKVDREYSSGLSLDDMKREMGEEAFDEYIELRMKAQQEALENGEDIGVPIGEEDEGDEDDPKVDREYSSGLSLDDMKREMGEEAFDEYMELRMKAQQEAIENGEDIGVPIGDDDGEDGDSDE